MQYFHLMCRISWSDIVENVYSLTVSLNKEIMSQKCALASLKCGIRYGNYTVINIGNS